MENPDDYFVECQTCALRFVSRESYMQHINGHKHKKKMKASMEKESKKHPEEDSELPSNSGDCPEDTEEIECEVCKKKCSGQIPYHQHLKSNTHYKNLRRQKVMESLQQYPGATEAIQIRPRNEEPSLLPEPFACCESCSKEFTGPESYKQHLSSIQHAKKLKDQKIVDAWKKDEKLHRGKELISAETNIGSFEEQLLKSLGDEPTEDRSEEYEFQFECKECHKAFSGPIPFAQHLTSKTHKKKLNSIQQMKLLVEMAEYSSDDWSDDSDDDELSCETCRVNFTSAVDMMAHLKSRKHMKLKKILKLKEELKEQQKLLSEKYGSKKTADSPVHSSAESSTDTDGESAQASAEVAKKREKSAASGGSEEKGASISIDEGENHGSSGAIPNDEKDQSFKKPPTEKKSSNIDAEKHEEIRAKTQRNSIAGSLDTSVEEKAIQTVTKQSNIQKVKDALRLAYTDVVND